MEGLTQAQIVVLQFPPKLSLSSLVNFESLKGTKFNALFDARADTQFERAAIDLLIVLASYRRIPSEPVLLRRSEPARSTIVRRALRYTFFFLAVFGELMLADYASVGFDEGPYASFSTHLCSTKTLRTA